MNVARGVPVETGPESGAELLRASLVALRAEAGVPMVFGGFTGAQGLTIAVVDGARAGSLQGLTVPQGTGMGGRVLDVARALVVDDYATAEGISHDHDAAIAAEGLAAICAVPLIRHRQVCGVIYGATRARAALTDHALRVMVEGARELEQRLAVAEALAAQPPKLDLEPAREAYAGLRALAGRLAPAERDEVLRLAELLTAPADEESIHLTDRELDVLACIAQGRSNAATAEQLGLKSETVKSYLRSASRRLGASSRWEAVIAARRHGLLP